MNRSVKIILAIAASLAALWLLSLPVKAWYLAPRKALLATIESSTATLADFRQADLNRAKVNKEIQGVVDRTLGGDFQTVDHKLRSRLKRLIEEAKLQNESVGTNGPPTAKGTPAQSRFSGFAGFRELRSEIDFYELQASLSGSGTFEQVLRLIDRIEAEPWIKRIDQLKLSPKDNGARFDVMIRLTTLFLPGRTPNPANIAATPGAIPGAGAGDRYQGLLARQPFRVPPPPPDPPAKPKPQPMTEPALAAGPPPFPYEQWSLTGIAQNAKGTEVWLFNTQTHEARLLTIGQGLHDAILTATNTDGAEFRLGEQRFLIAIGKTLNDRVQISK